MIEDFVSPLARQDVTALSQVDFAPFPLDEPLIALRRRMHGALASVADRLPAPWASEARATFVAYCGGEEDFYRLFYAPCWSFLHWIAAAYPISADLLQTAERCQSLALFWHLWDDHLSDRQLPLTMMRLQLRSLVREEWRQDALKLCQAAGVSESMVDQIEQDYLVSVDGYGRRCDLESYARHAICQGAIWTLAPLCLDRLYQTHLADIVGEFCVAWRLIDDIQDVVADIASGQANAVWHALSPAERAVLGEMTEEDLIGLVWSSGAVGRVAALAHKAVSRAAALAAEDDLFGYSAELRAGAASLVGMA